MLLADAVGTNDSAKRELVSLFEGVAVFETPKPVSLVAHLISICNGAKDATCLDFFSGTATTAHAVMQLNVKDGGNRKFIMVQLPEKCDEASEAYKAGITHPRITSRMFLTCWRATLRKTAPTLTYCLAVCWNGVCLSPCRTHLKKSAAAPSTPTMTAT